MKKKLLFILFLFIIFISCKKDEQVNSNDNNIPVSFEHLEINNIPGKFGRVIIHKNFNLNFILLNKYSGTAKNIIASIDNNKFKFLIDNPVITNSSANLIKPPCTKELDSKKECTISVSFVPVNENFEYGNLIIYYEVDSKKYAFKFPLSGTGVKQTNAQELLGKLKKTFSPVKKLIALKPHKNTLIDTILAVGHSKKFAYDDYFTTFSSKNVEVMKKQLSIVRVIGFTFRGDNRAPEINYYECGNDWIYGFKLKEPKTGNVISYPAHPKGTGCGIKDVGGFFPTFTRKSDIEKINILLNDYKNKNNGKEFDPTIDDFSVLKKSPTKPPVFTLSNVEILNWWLQSPLSLAAHSHSYYQFKGFISTTTNIFTAKSFSGNGTVYAMYQEGGYLLPDKLDDNYDLSTGGHMTGFSENEIAVPGAVDWDDIVAYLSFSGKNKDILMVRDGLKEIDKKAYDQIINEFSLIMK